LYLAQSGRNQRTNIRASGISERHDHHAPGQLGKLELSRILVYQSKFSNGDLYRTTFNILLLDFVRHGLNCERIYRKR